MSKINNNTELELDISDEQLHRITGQIFVGHGILIAYELGLFKLIQSKPQSIEQIAENLNLSLRTAQAIVSCACVLGFIAINDNNYMLSKLGQIYLIDNSPFYYGKVLDLLINKNEIMNYENIKRAILTNKSQIHNGQALFEANNNSKEAEAFVQAVHYKAYRPAFYWPKLIDLSMHNKFVDIGGGSGIHSIAVCLNYPNMTATVCDKQSVIPFTLNYIQNFDLESRIEGVVLDMWTDVLPIGDIYFFADIFHDWDEEKCFLLAKKTCQSLPKGGKIILHEMLFDDEKAGPFLTAAYNMKMMLWTEGHQFSYKEVNQLLCKAGFINIKLYKSLGNWSLIMGEKE